MEQINKSSKSEIFQSTLANILGEKLKIWIFTTIASAKTLDAAVKQATSDMAAILMEKLDLSLPDIVMLMSVAGHAQICQVVDPLMTARSVMPKWILDKYGFEF